MAQLLALIALTLTANVASPKHLESLVGVPRAKAAGGHPFVPLTYNPLPEDKADHFWKVAHSEAPRLIGSLRRPTIPRYGVLTVHGDPSIKEVALTFDDGPHRGFTEPLLTTLKKCRAPATFFVVGKMAEKSPDLVRLIDRKGHLIGNHSFSHPNMALLSELDDETEYLACSELLHRLTQKRVDFCRPPGGDLTKPVVEAAMRLGMTTTMSRCDPKDYANPGEAEIVRRTLKELRPGSIILLHDGVEQTIRALPRLIEAIRARGYKIVRLDALKT